MDVRRAAALALPASILCLLAVPPAIAAEPATTPPSYFPPAPEGYAVGSRAAVEIAGRDPKVAEQADRRGPLETAIEVRDGGAWQVGFKSDGTEVVQVIVELDPGVTSPRHTHPGEEIIYVLEGMWEYTLDGKPPVTLKAGDVLFIPAGTIHSARNVGTGRGAELATYIVEKGKPLLTPAK